ncbi:hypothetical protein INR75_06830 [Zunongwangia sp. SCSIO 43204]|uniref:hypothetical protein n=1 Tax=Zunongwangia sp. SCSIO 43204 TaxID=2779359 RepID=UPI001CA96625|nr:hypothetical protein [Zunongwangia sp. SCSIO 43204]UAB85722.1 hypothetical protein INR75_06830 [Zunongwangia sp. SCSIO 43204]
MQQFLADKKMIELIDILKASGKIRFQSEFCRAVDILPQVLNNVKNSTNHFTPVHIENACKKYNINANWIFGLTDEIFTTTNTSAYTKP